MHSKSQKQHDTDKKGDLLRSSKLISDEDYRLYCENKYDCCAFLIFCPFHKNVAISKSEDTLIVWLPFIPLPNGRCWNEGAFEGALIILSNGNGQQFQVLKNNPPFDESQCMQVFRFQLPHTLNFVTRLIYYIRLNNSNDRFICCQDTFRIKWKPLNDLLNCYIENLWGPELIEFSKLAQIPIVQQVLEYSLEKAFFFVPRDPPRNLEESILKSAHITEKDVERLYADFIGHCFPSFYQTFESFKCYMEKNGFEKNDDRLTSLFNAFNFYCNGFLSFHELLLGLASIDPNTIHSEWRVRFVFRYYNVSGSGYLNVNDEFRKMIIDMNPDSSAQKIEQKLKEALQIIEVKMINGLQTISSEDFLAAVGSHRFRGTSYLCRSSKSIFAQISRTTAAISLKKLKTMNIGPIIKQFKGKCLTCKDKKYSLATHSVKINSNGRIVEPVQLVESKSTIIDEFTAQKYSVEFVFNKNSAANLMIEFIRQFNSNKGTSQNPKGLLQNNIVVLWKLIWTLYNDIDVLLNNEDKCPRICSPCYIFGDIHGNLDDLLSFEKAIWKRLPCVGANFLFLGDYVDRGRWGIECFLYLICFKILCPNKVILLRGNHEVRSIQTFYTYKNECVKKYGESFGLKIWEITNKIFDKLPLSAVVDNAIFCAHGGIPKSARSINEINQIKKELPDPEKESSIAWEILWSDPCHDQQFIEMCNFLKIDFKETQGFLPNLRRGTAFQFNEFAASKFLRNNRLTHLIRAHEVPQAGFMFHFGNKCTTIFSCSHYCGNQNNCACILADNQLLRIQHLDTVNNAPATD